MNIRINIRADCIMAENQLSDICNAEGCDKSDQDNNNASAYSVTGYTIMNV